MPIIYKEPKAKLCSEQDHEWSPWRENELFKGTKVRHCKNYACIGYQVLSDFEGIKGAKEYDQRMAAERIK